MCVCVCVHCDYHKYLGASGNGAIQIPHFPTKRSNASRGDQSGTCEGEVPPSQGSYITRSWRAGADVSILWSSIHCTDWTLRPLKVEALTQPHRPLRTPCSSRCRLQSTVCVCVCACMCVCMHACVSACVVSTCLLYATNDALITPISTDVNLYDRLPQLSSLSLDTYTRHNTHSSVHPTIICNYICCCHQFLG